MTDVTMPLKDEIARLDREINEKRHEITCLQEELDDLEAERSDLLDEFDEDEEN